MAADTDPPRRSLFAVRDEKVVDVGCGTPLVRS